MGKNKTKINEEVTLSKYVSHEHTCHIFVSHASAASRKDAKKVQKLEAQIPYHEGRGNKDEAQKIRDQVAAIWEKAKEAAFA